ncbi:MAG: DMT family transporter [Anaerolineae bacterium]|jgi:drug/metabolite transporter (DMT)-like permease
MANTTRSARIKADLTLFLVALIWGSTFVAQRAGNDYVGPLTFNTARFLVGSLFLIPPLIWQRRRSTRAQAPSSPPQRKENLWRNSFLLGLILFGGISLQQIGLVTTTAGKGGFITGLYVVIVPLMLALFWRERVRWHNWAGAGLAVTGLFLLSISLREKFQLNPGDIWVLCGALVWALHVIATGKIAPGRDPLRLAVAQYLVCALLCAIPALVLEWKTWGGLLEATPAILYAGVLSTGLAFTGQIAAQRHAPPADAAIIMSMETVFAALAGWLVLSETLTSQQLMGCVLMFAGMLLAQVSSFVHATNTARSAML